MTLDEWRQELDNSKVGPHLALEISYISTCVRASLVAQMLKNLPSMQETWVRSLGQEDPLKKGMATYSSILA